MEQFSKLKTEFQNSQKSFTDGIKQLTAQLQEQQNEETGRVSLDDGFIDKQPSDFSLHYCLSESMVQLERCIAEKPSRELSIVKTKLQEAIFWASQS